MKRFLIYVGELSKYSSLSHYLQRESCSPCIRICVPHQAVNRIRDMSLIPEYNLHVILFPYILVPYWNCNASYTKVVWLASSKIDQASKNHVPYLWAEGWPDSRGFRGGEESYRQNCSMRGRDASSAPARGRRLAPEWVCRQSRCMRGPAA